MWFWSAATSKSSPNASVYMAATAVNIGSLAKPCSPNVFSTQSCVRQVETAAGTAAACLSTTKEAVQGLSKLVSHPRSARSHTGTESAQNIELTFWTSWILTASTKWTLTSHDTI